MDKNILLIIVVVALVLMIYVIRYIISRVVHKGADAIENKIRQVHSEKHPAENQSLADRLGVQSQNPPAVQSNQIPPLQPQPGNLADIQEVPVRGQAASFCVKCGAPVKPGSSFCAQCGAEVKKN